ncbi:CopG family transcriptional regulator [Patescibacteria group bacterium AH-259-L05]|nr:CopG family transcriptional regulator [Patescibacteria group bacterium AH-259-L05]
MPLKKRKFTTVSIPSFLFNRIKKRIKNTGFPSVSSYVAYVLREIEASGDKNKALSKEAETKLKKKLKDLGYL